jgi:cytochrome b6-f complex iron-sulfur subunit
MAEKVADLSGDDREQRVAELKRKMQQAAQKAQATHAEETPVAPAPVANAVTAVNAAPAAIAEAPAAVSVVEAPVVESVTEPTHAENGATQVVETPAASAVVARPAPAPRPAAVDTEADAEETSGKGINRREFLTYAWGAALGLLTLEGGVDTFLFLYPRFRAGEFGGDFIKPTTDFGNKDAAPNPEPSGKFWQVTTAEGKHKALYMVCVHLGCLYKWVPANNRFECPCHGSKYTHDGFYIEGPATRSLDTFEITDEGDKVIVHTGKKVIGQPSEKSPARAVVA